MGVSQICSDLNIKNKRHIIYVIGAIILLIIFNFVYKRIKTHENFMILSELQDLASINENAILNSTNQVIFADSSIGNYFTGSSTGNTLTDILSDIYSKVNKNTTSIAKNIINTTANTTNSSYLQTSTAIVWGISNQALTIVNNLSPLPVGTIIAWNQPTVPDATWKLCDGSSYSYMDNTGPSPKIVDITTPNLSGRFVLSSSPSHNLGDIGGEETHKLTVPELPLHFHQSFVNNPGSLSNPYAPDNPTPADVSGISRNWGSYDPRGTAEKNVTGAGGDKPHNNMPPFYVLTYIMKVYKNVNQSTTGSQK